MREETEINVEQNGLVYTNDKCVGCNKCINVCGSMGACVASMPDERGRARIDVNSRRCIACGACFDACEHQAREYRDDTDRFLQDLQAGEPISILIAPAFMANYPQEYERVLGGLKALGARHLINVSFGADISTWGYAHCLRDKGMRGIISQPCPAVVEYVEHYMPSLIPRMVPVQSPLMCAAIYARKVMGIEDRFAFISPCIAKKKEIDDPFNQGLVSYNVTFVHLMERVQELDLYGPPCSDEIEYGLGSVYPMPGGLSENIAWLLGEDLKLREVSGEERLYRYLRHNREQIRSGAYPFDMYDFLNCESGCLCGTATDMNRAETDEALSQMLQIRSNVVQTGSGAWSRDLSPSERLDALDAQFAALDPADYVRIYKDKSASCITVTPTDHEFEEVFLAMNKRTEESRHIDCTGCGYDTCRDMVTAIVNGFNHRRNCVYYLKSIVEGEKENAEEVAARNRGILKAQHAVISDLVSDVNTHFSRLRSSISGIFDEGEENGEHDFDEIEIKEEAASRAIDEALEALELGTGTTEDESESVVMVHAYENMVRLMRDQIDYIDKLAHRDGLTGLRNVYSFQEARYALDEQIRKGSARFGFCMVDVNNLKQINDEYGHEYGDAHIKQAVAYLHEAFPGCPVYRTGGDEFVIMMEREALSHAHQMMMDLDRIQMEEEAKDGEPWEKVSMACGLAIYDPSTDDSVATVLHRADNVMYQKKEIMHQARKR